MTSDTLLAEQLAQLLAAKGVSRSELARRLAAILGKKPSNERRWLNKILKSEIQPMPRRLAAIEAALDLSPGTLQRRERPTTRVRQAQTEELSARLGVAEEQLEELLLAAAKNARRIGTLDRRAQRNKAVATTLLEDLSARLGDLTQRVRLLEQQRPGSEEQEAQ